MLPQLERALRRPAASRGQRLPHRRLSQRLGGAFEVVTGFRAQCLSFHTPVISAGRESSYLALGLVGEAGGLALLGRRTESAAKRSAISKTLTNAAEQLQNP